MLDRAPGQNDRIEAERLGDDSWHAVRDPAVVHEVALLALPQAHHGVEGDRAPGRQGCAQHAVEAADERVVRKVRIEPDGE